MKNKSVEEEKIVQEAHEFFLKISDVITNMGFDEDFKEMLEGVFTLGWHNGFIKGYIARDRLEYKGNGKYK